MKVLVTGGFGYVGGRLAQFLVSEGPSEVVLGTRQPGRSATWLPTAAVVQTDWSSPEQLEDVCRGCDAVVHLAGMSAGDCAADPVAALQVNGINTAQLVRAAGRAGVGRFIFVSTAHVYGNPLEGCITEDTCPMSLHPYATSNRAGEDAVRGALQRGAVDGVVVRLSNAYGAPAHEGADCWSLLVNDLCCQAVTTGRIELRSSGLQRRDFVPLTDVCRAIGHLLEADAQQLGQRLFNVGGAWAPTVRELGELVAARCEEVLGLLPPVTAPLPAAGEATPALAFGIDALRNLGFELSADREGEIDGAIEFCRKVFAGPDGGAPG